MDNKKIEELYDRIEKLENGYQKTSEFFELKISNNNKKINNQKIIIVCITIVLIVSLLLNAFTIYELNQYEYVEETTENYEIEQETNDDSQINNINGNQYNDNAIHND
jgi:hypothetical protein